MPDLTPVEYVQALGEQVYRREPLVCPDCGDPQEMGSIDLANMKAFHQTVCRALSNGATTGE